MMQTFWYFDMAWKPSQGKLTHLFTLSPATVHPRSYSLLPTQHMHFHSSEPPGMLVSLLERVPILSVWTSLPHPSFKVQHKCYLFRFSILRDLWPSLQPTYLLQRITTAEGLGACLLKSHNLSVKASASTFWCMTSCMDSLSVPVFSSQEINEDNH